ncbi:uncharacterized protein DS421_10g309800 [Arachis hypogaea]|nr:uncharacterized protein DS421_10g309800 [Arachis hypogaea]
MCCNNFHIVIFSGCHLTTAVVFSPVIGVSTLNSCVVIVSILFLCQRCFLKGEWCLISNTLFVSRGITKVAVVEVTIHCERRRHVTLAAL